MADGKKPRADGDEPRKKTAKRKRPDPVYVPVRYPYRLGAASFAWAVVGWLAAAAAPHLAFVPGVAVLHYLLPTITAGLLGVNLVLAVRNLFAGVHVLRLALVTGVQVALFTTLFFQLYAHGGAELYDAPGATTPWQWLQFSAAHAFRASDVFDAVEAYGWGIQTVKHTSPVVGLVVVAFHVVVDVFFLGLVWAGIARFRAAVLADDEFRGMVMLGGKVVFAAWFVAWFVVAVFVQRWRFLDIPLWFLENLVRVVDVADVMESFGVRFHTLPREGLVGTLTLFCRLFIGVGLAALVVRKRTPADRAVLTPPDAPAGYWRLRVGALAGMAAAFAAVGFVGAFLTGSAAAGLAAAVTDGPDGRAEAALRALRRMGPAAGPVAPDLVASRAAASPAVRDGITRTLGYLGPDATDPLRDIALADPPESAAVAADALAEVGGPAAPALVAVWDATPADAVKARAEVGLRRLGAAAVGPLIDGITPENSFAHYQWLQQLDANWVLRSTPNGLARSCQSLPGLVGRASSPDPAVAAAAMNDIRACGSAARVVLDAAYQKLGDKDGALQAAAVGVVVSAGPRETPALLGMAREAIGKTGAVPPGVYAALGPDSMWTPQALADPATLPALLAFAARADGAFPIALARLGHYGPKAAAAAPHVVPKVAAPDGGTRAAARATLARIEPNWKALPAFTDKAGELVYPIARLPKDEADDLLAALPPLTTPQAGRLSEELRGQVREVNKNVGRVKTPGEAKGYAAALDPAFAPIEQLGPKAKAMVPALTGYAREAAKSGNDPRNPVLGKRILAAVEKIDPRSAEALVISVAGLGNGPEALALLKAKGKAAVPALLELLASPEEETRAAGVRLATDLGPDAAEVVPQLIRLLIPETGTVQAPRKADLTGAALIRALNAADPDWWGRPGAGEAVADTTPFYYPGGTDAALRAERAAVFAAVAAAGPRAAPAVPALAAKLFQTKRYARDARPPLDAADPMWRERRPVAALVPGLVKTLVETDRLMDTPLTELGPPAAAAVVAAMAALDPEHPVTPNTRLRLIAVLARFDPPAKAAIPAVLATVGDERMNLLAVQRVLEAAGLIDRRWADDPANKDARARAGEALLKRAEKKSEFFAPAAAIGVPVSPALAKWAAGRGSYDKAEVCTQLAGYGPAALPAAAFVAEVAATEPHYDCQTKSFDALRKIAAGQAALAPTLVPVLLDAHSISRPSIAPALDALDPKWRESAAGRKLAAAAAAQLGSAAVEKKANAALTLAEVGATDAAAVSALTKLLLDTEPPVRAAAAAALDKGDPAWRTKPGAKAAAAAAVKQLADAGPRKRFDAVGALDLIRPAEAVAPLEALVARETDANTKQYAQQVLGRIRKKE